METVSHLIFSINQKQTNKKKCNGSILVRATCGFTQRKDGPDDVKFIYTSAVGVTRPRPAGKGKSRCSVALLRSYGDAEDQSCQPVCFFSL